MSGGKSSFRPLNARRHAITRLTFPDDSNAFFNGIYREIPHSIFDVFLNFRVRKNSIRNCSSGIFEEYTPIGLNFWVAAHFGEMLTPSRGACIGRTLRICSMA